MNDLGFELRKAYHTALSGNLTDVSGNAVSIYDSVPSDAGDIYAYYESFNTNDNNTTKDTFMQLCQQTIVVVANFNGDHGGFKEVDNVCDQIISIIRTRSQLSMDSPFSMITTRLQNSARVPVNQVEGGKSFARSITFEHKIYE